MPRTPRRLRWVVLGLLLQIWSCTLTDGSFTPSRIQALTPDAGAIAAPLPSEAPPPSESPQPMAAADAGMTDVCQGTEQLPGCPLLQAAPPECSDDSDCGSRHCADGACIAASCDDGIANQGESGTDCGGPCAVRCPEGQGCTSSDDCAAGLFCPEAARLCAQPSCADGVRDGDETATDCGGGCPPCAEGSGCGADPDCATGVCRAGTCVAPSCDDALTNQDETGTDCGGSCAPCGPGSACRVGSDCDSGVCDGRGCAPGLARCCQPPRCNDNVRNGSEPFTDCGNAQCGACPIGSLCVRGADCESGLCQNGVCRVQPCLDRQRNGLETDVDCGGADPACARCAIGQVCQVAQDCSPGASCLSGRCANCGNGQRDGSETDSDCGGVCGPCGAGQSCNLDSECQSGICQDNRCCGGNRADCTRCARALAATASCDFDAAASAQCNAFLQCLADNSELCPTRLTAGCADAGGVCDSARFGGNGSAAITLADSIIGTAQCSF